jgi:hypothetical protein
MINSEVLAVLLAVLNVVNKLINPLPTELTL